MRIFSKHLKPCSGCGGASHLRSVLFITHIGAHMGANMGSAADLCVGTLPHMCDSNH